MPECRSSVVRLGDHFHPANAVEALLEHIIGTGHEIIVFPQPQAIPLYRLRPCGPHAAYLLVWSDGSAGIPESPF